MKVSLNITLDVDIESWTNEYGCDRDEIRDDVKTYFANLIRRSEPTASGMVKDVEVKR